MRPFSDDCHKALLPVAGTTILARIVKSLLDVHVEKITVVTGYRAFEVEEYLNATFPSASFEFVRNERFLDTNNIVSLSLALERLDLAEDILLIECDVLFHPVILEKLAGYKKGNVALVDRYRPGMDGTVVSVSQGVVTQVFPPHLQGPDFEYGDKFKTLNIYRFDANFCRNTLQPLVNVYANGVDPGCYYEVVLATIANLARQGITAEIVEGDLWTEIDDPNDLAAARFHFEPAKRSEILDRQMGAHWSFQVLDFSFMRNRHFPTEAMLASMRHALPELTGEYGSTQTVLNEKLAWFLGCAPSRLEVLNGGSQAFPILGELFAGKSVAAPAPTFGEYARTFPNRIEYPDAPGIDLDQLEDLASDSAVVVVVNPNNPTGTTVPTAELYSMAERNRSTQFLIDESFAIFSSEPSIMQLLEKDPLENVMVLTSLSKSLGVPGLRLGYLYSCSSRMLEGVNKRLPIWNLNSVAEYFLELLLKFRPELEASIASTIADREQLRAGLLALGGVADVWRSGGNFLLVRLHGDSGLAGRIRTGLLTDAAINVKDVTARFPDNFPRLRLGVRRPEDNERLLSALEAALPALTLQEEPA